MSDEFKQLAIKRKITELFTNKTFYVTSINELSNLLGVSINHEIYEQLRAYHCAPYSSMSEREKELLQEKVIECLRGDSILNPARVLNALTDEGRDFTFSEDRYIDGQNPVRRLS